MFALMLFEMAHGIVWTYGWRRRIDAIEFTVLSVHLIDLYLA